MQRDFLYNGEQVLIDTVHDATKVITSSKGVTYNLPNAHYVVDSETTSLEIQHMVFRSKRLRCGDPYCIVSNSEECSVDEELVRRDLFRVVNPFSVRERLVGNRIQVRVAPSEQGPEAGADGLLVALNGVQMDQKGRCTYSVKLNQLDDDGLDELVYAVHARSHNVQCTYPSKIALPRDFRYVVSVKQQAGRFFLRIVLYKRNSALERYVIVFRGRADNPEMVIDGPDELVEVFAEFVPREAGARKSWADVSINGHGVSFPFRRRE